MKYTDLTKRAMKLCFAAHKDQYDKSGLPYVFHPFHLAEQMEGEDEICVALLHDVVEDSPYTLENLKLEGFPEEIIEAVKLMTHETDVPYMDYIKRISSNPIARRVKMADLIHNSDISRLDCITERDKKRVEKYQKALKLLEDGVSF